ncbi:MAG TPA: SprT family zinc-dependent metalloprotease [Oscillospiraceae bacterium]|nr:SprT family zinc-dependent metalloprotease [Oscillospiraceae bacterium]
MIEYKLIRSRRRTLAICITKDGKAEVRAPLKLPQSVIDRFVNSKQSWIAQKTAVMAARAQKRQEFLVQKGNLVTLLGQEYPVVPGAAAAFDGKQFIVPFKENQIEKAQLIAIYKQLAKQEIEKRTEYFSRKMGLLPSAVKIGNANTYWGCCSAKNSIIFTWKLIMAEPSAIDYVVVHELAHIKEHNHSARFWALVRSILPDYNLQRAKLKELQQKLSNEDWN